MNDRYLFKAKRVDNQEWVIGWISWDIHNHPWIEYRAGTSQYETEVIEDTVCQFTTLTDKNGEGIWEGDIVKCHDHPTGVEDGIYEVVFERGAFKAGNLFLSEWGSTWLERIQSRHDTNPLQDNKTE